MPAGDGTGPLGWGPMTGRAAGYCAGFPVPGFMNPMPGRAMFGQYALGAYPPVPHTGAVAAYGYAAAYPPIGRRAMGWFGPGFGRGRGRGFGRGGGRGRRWFGW